MPESPGVLGENADIQSSFPTVLTPSSGVHENAFLPNSSDYSDAEDTWILFWGTHPNGCYSSHQIRRSF